MTQEITIEMIEAADRFHAFMVRGIRPKTFQNLVILADHLSNYHYRDAFGPIRERHNQNHIPSNFNNYLAIAQFDKEEIKYVSKWLGVSERTARDYLRTLYKLSLKF